MLRVLDVIACLFLFAVSANAGFGAHWSLNLKNDQGNHVLQAITTLEVPATPSPQVNNLFLWPGMNIAGGGLIQSIIVTSLPDKSNPNVYECDAQPGQWCAFSYLLGNPKGFSSKRVPVNQGDMLQMNYTYDPSSGNYTQAVTRGDTLISSLNTATNGWAANFYIEVECHINAIGATPAHTYHNTTIVLAEADPQFTETLSRNQSDNTDLSSPDGGKTWTVDTINIEAAECYPNASDISAAGNGSSLDNSTSPVSVSMVTSTPTTALPTGSSSAAPSSSSGASGWSRYETSSGVWMVLFSALAAFCF